MEKAPVLRRKVKLVQEPTVLANGQILPPLPVKTPSDSYVITLLMLFQHVADVHISVLEIMAEKYGHDMDEMIDTIQKHPKWHDMLINPLVHDLTEKIVGKAIPPVADIPDPPAVPAPAPDPPATAVPKKVVIRRRIKVQPPPSSPDAPANS